MESNVTFGLLLVLYAIAVVLEHKRSQRRRKIVEWVPFLVPPLLGGIGWMFPGARRVVLVLVILYALWALSMMIVKWRKR